MKPAVKTMQELELHHRDITELYSLAEALVETTENELVRDKEAHLTAVEPLVEAMVDGADMISEEFFVVVNGKATAKSNSKTRIEQSLRKIYNALHAFTLHTSDQAKETSRIARKVCEPILTKIKRQLEAVVAGMMEFITLSLDRVMQKHDVEELKRRHERIAFMLHQLSTQPSQA
jgi:hypothetical protein